jgi:hypothetical protein
MAMMKNEPEYLRRKEAADYLKARYGIGSANWLAKLAVTGGGPIYSKAGHTPLYLRADINAWMQGRMTRRASTSVTLDAASATGAQDDGAAA